MGAATVVWLGAATTGWLEATTTGWLEAATTTVELGVSVLTSGTTRGTRGV